MGAAQVAVPDGFVLDGQPAANDYHVDPATQAARDQTRLAILQDEQKRYPDPATQAALATEIEQTQKKVPASAPEAAPAIPDGFVLDAPAAPKNTTASRLFAQKPVKLTDPEFDSTVGTGQYILNQAKVGLAAGAGGMLADLTSMLPRAADESKVERVIDLSQTFTPVGLASTIAKMTQDALSEPGEPKFGTSAYLAKKFLGYEPDLKAPTPEARFAGKVAEFAAGGLLGPRWQRVAAPWVSRLRIVRGAAWLAPFCLCPPTPMRASCRRHGPS